MPLGVALLAALIYIIFLQRNRSRSTQLLHHLRSQKENENGVQEQQSVHGEGYNEMGDGHDPAWINMPQLHGHSRAIAQLPA